MMPIIDSSYIPSHIESNCIKAIRRLCIAFTAVSLCACTTAGMFSPTVELKPETDKVASAIETQKPDMTQSWTEGCTPLAPPPSFAPTADERATKLNDDFNAVRIEHGISRIGFSPDAYRIAPDALLQEVKRLRDAKTSYNADPKAALTGLDAVEKVLVAKLPPWAGDRNVTLPGLLAQANTGSAAAPPAGTPSTGTLSQSAQDAVGAASDALKLATTKASPLNALIDAAQLRTDVSDNNARSLFQREDHRRLFQDLQTLQVLRAFHFLTLVSAVQIHKMAMDNPPPGDAALKPEIRIFNLARFLSTYFDAYFRSGHFLEVTDNGNALLKLGSDGFVSRAGMSTQFAGIDYAVTTHSGNGITERRGHCRSAKIAPENIDQGE
jgi:hypothetical protein